MLVSAVRSRRGASFRLLSLVGTERFEICLSVPLVLEYEDALRRHAGDTGLTARDIAALLDYLCRVGLRQEVFFLWRPLLRDPKDDMVLELAVAAQADAVVTFNLRDFEHAALFGIPALRPRSFLEFIGELP